MCRKTEELLFCNDPRWGGRRDGDAGRISWTSPAPILSRKIIIRFPLTPIRSISEWWVTRTRYLIPECVWMGAGLGQELFRRRRSLSKNNNNYKNMHESNQHQLLQTSGSPDCADQSGSWSSYDSCSRGLKWLHMRPQYYKIVEKYIKQLATSGFHPEFYCKKTLTPIPE